MYFVGDDPCRGVDGVVVCALHVWELLVPVGSLFTDQYGKHQSHRIIKALDATVSAGLIGAGGDLVNAEALVKSAGKVRSKLKSVVGNEGDEASPERDVAVDEDVGGA